MNEEKNKELIFKPSIAIPPGETLLEVINSLNITQVELARRMGRPLKLVNEIVKGKTAITPETALQLEQVLGKPDSFWRNLESTFQGLKAREEMIFKFEEMKDEASTYPYLEMSKLGWVPKTKNFIERIENLLQFFSATTFDNIVEKQEYKGAFSISAKHKYSLPGIYTWLRQGQRVTEKIETKEFDKDKLLNYIPIIRQLTKESDPRIFIPELERIFSDCGVVFVVIPSLTNVPIFGSTRWINSQRALLQMSIRLKWSDFFWFNLFHEIGHLLNDGKKDFNVDFINQKPNNDSETRAENFARDNLIDPIHFNKLINQINASKRKQTILLELYSIVKLFSEKINIHPGIVVGRLQHDGHIPQNFNKLRERLEWEK